ncbi:hypothetical protein DFH09DRAFT_900107 [Mycena vulgaris]|nr:hypothetical protein DFH09DRAFT_900107 [Mycena vulgaris]
MNNDPVHTFLMEAHNIIVQAQFIMDSLPNVELPAVEQGGSDPSRHNVRIERLWRDVRKDALETFRQIFAYLEQNNLLDMENPIHSTCLFLVFHHRIQAALDRSREAWNHHRMRTQRDKTPPVAIYELSRTHAITRGYWTGDPGDDVNVVTSDPLYGHDGEAPLPPPGISDNEPLERTEQPAGTAAERESGILVNGDEDLMEAQQLLGDFDCDADDGKGWGIEVYCEAVLRMIAQLGVPK